MTNCRDIEKKPGLVIDFRKTIKAPHSQDKVVLFGSNPVTQCVSMSLISLVYNYGDSIAFSLDLIYSLDIGNERYSGTSRLPMQSYLMVTELPEMVSVFNSNYQLQYSSSYIKGLCCTRFQLLYASN